MAKGNGDAKNFLLAPSDLTFLLHECGRCFYLKVEQGIDRASSPMPKIFTVIDRQQRRFFDGTASEDLHPELPPGAVRCTDSAVLSAPLKIPKRNATVQFRGAVDTTFIFDDDSFGIVDFKTTDPRDSHVRLYSLQLHAYALAFENPALGRTKIAPVTKLGLLCFEPVGMMRLPGGDFAYRTEATWIEVPRDDASFLAFLSLVVGILERPVAPESSPDCRFCAPADRLAA
jgi:hypothetical protein